MQLEFAEIMRNSQRLAAKRSLRSRALSIPARRNLRSRALVLSGHGQLRVAIALRAYHWPTSLLCLIAQALLAARTAKMQERRALSPPLPHCQPADSNKHQQHGDRNEDYRGHLQLLLLYIRITRGPIYVCPQAPACRMTFRCMHCFSNNHSRALIK
jgi:hypothetical protein